jgi:hypothetical protein
MRRRDVGKHRRIGEHLKCNRQEAWIARALTRCARVRDSRFAISLAVGRLSHWWRNLWLSKGMGSVKTQTKSKDLDRDHEQRVRNSPYGLHTSINFLFPCPRSPSLPVLHHFFYTEADSQQISVSRIPPSSSPMSRHPFSPRFSSGVIITRPTPPLPRQPILMIRGERLQRLENGIQSVSIWTRSESGADGRFIQVDQEMLFEIILAAK